jgi:outer membrane biosynthesis protein TonB
MRPLHSIPVLLAVFLLAMVSGCARKKPVLVMPTQPPPPAAPSPAATPPLQAQQQPPQIGPQPSPTPQETPAPTETAQKPRNKPRHAGGKKPSPQVPAGEKNATETARNTRPRVIENENIPASTTPPAPNPKIAQEQASTEQLLQNTETALSGIKRQLSHNEQTMVAQIKDFIVQSRDASKKNDLLRAHNLAWKAHLLSDELVKRQ